MKNLSFLILFFINWQSVFCQSASTPSRPDIMVNSSGSYLSFFGKMNDELWNRLTEEEKIAYDSCLTIIGLTRDNIKWVSDELFNNLRQDNNYVYKKLVSYDLLSGKINTRNVDGKNRLPSPECFFDITRIQNNCDKISIFMYY